MAINDTSIVQHTINIKIVDFSPPLHFTVYQFESKYLQRLESLQKILTRKVAAEAKSEGMARAKTAQDVLRDH